MREEREVEEVRKSLRDGNSFPSHILGREREERKSLRDVNSFLSLCTDNMSLMYLFS